MGYKVGNLTGTKAVGMFHLFSHSLAYLYLGRMCREGHSEQPPAFIPAEPKFFGDKVAVKIKEDRASEEASMTGSVQGARADGETSCETFKNSLRELGPFYGAPGGQEG